jgi:hypothetical protein
MSNARWWWCTAPTPGAIAVACIEGTAAELDSLARTLTGADAPGSGGIAWRRFGDFDDGVLARPSARTMLVMPHGGARIRTMLARALESAGARAGAEVCVGASARTGAGAHARAIAHARATYPEATSDVEALALATMAHAASPRAVDLLLAQAERWQKFPRASRSSDRSAQLARLIHPARVVVTGAANAGKSTLMNALAGRAVAVAHDQPGTTRDAVAVRLNLDGVAVDWFDTAGVRAEADAGHAHAAEAHAARLAQHLLAHADLVVQLSAPGLGWHALPGARSRLREDGHADSESHADSGSHPDDAAPCIRVLNKCDAPEFAVCAERACSPIAVSALRGDGLADLVHRVRTILVPDSAMNDPSPWCFHEALGNDCGAGDSATLLRP